MNQSSWNTSMYVHWLPIRRSWLPPFTSKKGLIEPFGSPPTHHDTESLVRTIWGRVERVTLCQAAEKNITHHHHGVALKGRQTAAGKRRPPCQTRRAPQKPHYHVEHRGRPIHQLPSHCLRNLPTVGVVVSLSASAPASLISQQSTLGSIQHGGGAT